MTGSTLSLIVIPIVAVICLAVMLIMVYYADSHPQWRADHPAREPDSTNPAALASPRRPDGELGGDAVRFAGNRPDLHRQSGQTGLRP